MTSKEIELEKVVKKACDNIYNERVDFFNIFSLKTFNLMKEKNVLDIFNSVILYVEDNGKLYKYNKETGELELL